MTERIVTLEAVYDNSDVMTDYFDGDSGIEEWYVMPIDKPITEQKLRMATRQPGFPQWLRDLPWTFRKGEKYSMSDHPYGQLRFDQGFDGVFIKGTSAGSGHMSKVRLIVSSSSLSIFKMNSKAETKIPPTFDEFKAFIEGVNQEREQRRVAIAAARAQ